MYVKKGSVPGLGEWSTDEERASLKLHVFIYDDYDTMGVFEKRMMKIGYIGKGNFLI